MEKRYKLVNLDRPDRLELRMHDFSASDVPRGFASYNMEVLADSQQTKLNVLKVNIVRENQKYLAAHPEIRALVALLLRYIFAKCPHFHIHRSITDFFSQSRAELENVVTEYLSERGQVPYYKRPRRDKRGRGEGEFWEGYGGEEGEKSEESTDVSGMVKKIISNILAKVVPSDHTNASFRRPKFD